MPELGVNALLRGAKMVTKLEDFGFNRTPHEVLGLPTINVGRMHGGMNINSVPDRAEIGLDVRTIPGMDHRDVVGWLRAHVAPELDEISSIIDLQPIWTDPLDPWVQRVYALLVPHLGEHPVARGVPYFSDASVLTAALGGPPTIILGPGESRMAHQIDEYCLVHLIEQSVTIYGDILRDWLSAGQRTGES
jgi:succinyl-diaminopimelate desuccinylase